MPTGDITQIVANAIEQKLRAAWPYIDIEQGHNGYYDDQWQELAHDAAEAAVATLLGTPGP